MSDFHLTDSQRAILRQWLRIIEDENDRSTACVRGEDYRMPGDPEVLTDWLWVESSLTNAALEERIRGFSKGAKRGELTGAEHFHLVRRFVLARVVIEEILKGSEGVLKRITRWPGKFDDQSEMNSWLLIEVWNMFGEDALASWADSFLKGVFINEETQTWHWDSASGLILKKSNWDGSNSEPTNLA